MHKKEVWIERKQVSSYLAKKSLAIPTLQASLANMYVCSCKHNSSVVVACTNEILFFSKSTRFIPYFG